MADVKMWPSVGNAKHVKVIILEATINLLLS